ncbi:MAG: heimdallarchaeosortase [Candidatus Heimdallarchaeota archaeon]
MSQPSWYPNNPRKRLNFFLKSFPIFVVLLVFFLFVLDWLGFFAFLEELVRDNGSWLMQVIFGVDSSEFTLGIWERIDPDPLTGQYVGFGSPFFPGIFLRPYPNIFLIVRGCTGMEAGALLMALILVTPAKWSNKLVATVVNFLMMHIGNTFRVAFHFWFTKLLYLRWNDADKAFFYAHDLLSKVFGFIGIVIFTLVIERTGVKIVSTFGAWMDAAGEGLKRLTWKMKDISFVQKIFGTSVGTAVAVTSVGALTEGSTGTTTEASEVNDALTQVTPTRVVKVPFYPTYQIENNKWSFFLKSFGIFLFVGGVIVSLGLIPAISKGFMTITDNIAVNWFGARISATGQTNSFWWYSIVDRATIVPFTMHIFNIGFGMLGIFLGLIFATPTSWRKRISGSILAIVIIIPLNILRIGVQKWAVYSVVNNDTMRKTNPVLYMNMADVATTWLPLFFWIILFLGLIFILYKIDIKAIAVIVAWGHQLWYWLSGILGLRKKENEDDLFEKEKQQEKSTS